MFTSLNTSTKREQVVSRFRYKTTRSRDVLVLTCLLRQINKHNLAQLQNWGVKLVLPCQIIFLNLNMHSLSC